MGPWGHRALRAWGPWGPWGTWPMARGQGPRATGDGPWAWAMGHDGPWARMRHCHMLRGVQMERKELAKLTRHFGKGAYNIIRLDTLPGPDAPGLGPGPDASGLGARPRVWARPRPSLGLGLDMACLARFLVNPDQETSSSFPSKPGKEASNPGHSLAAQRSLHAVLHILTSFLTICGLLGSLQ